MRVLFLSSWFPTPPINGAKIHINNLLWYLIQRHEVTLLSFVNTLSPEILDVEVRKWQKVCPRVVTIKRPQPIPLLAALGLATPLPQSVVSTYRPEILRQIQDLCQETRPDAIVASDVGPGIGVPVYGTLVRGVPKILDGLEFDLRSVQSPRGTRLKQLRSRLMVYKARRFIASLLRSFDACTVPSALEAERITPLAPVEKPPVVIPHGLDLDYLKQDPDVVPLRNSAIFSGSLTFAPNADALTFYVSDILHHVTRLTPELRLHVVGERGTWAQPKAHYTQHIEWLGMQFDVRPFIASSWMSIVPLRQGMGTRLKIIESMALGTPVVSTSKGAEGLQVTPEFDILIADTPQQFAEQMARLSRDADLRTRLGINGRKTVEKFYDRTVTGKQFDELLQKVHKR